MGSHRSFGHLKHKLWLKEGPGVKLVVWLPTTKSQESTRFPYVQMACDISLESSWQGLQLCLRTHLNLSLLAKLWGSKVGGDPTWAISGLPLKSPGTKSHLDVDPVERYRVYYKGEGGGFPQVWAMVTLVCPCCLWLILPSNVFQLRINHLVWVFCTPVWVNETCELFLIPSQSSSTPFYPSKCCELGSVPRLLLLLFSHIWVFQGVGNASKGLCIC